MALVFSVFSDLNVANGKPRGHGLVKVRDKIAAFIPKARHKGALCIKDVIAKCLTRPQGLK